MLSTFLSEFPMADYKGPLRSIALLGLGIAIGWWAHEMKSAEESKRMSHATTTEGKPKLETRFVRSDSPTGKKHESKDSKDPMIERLRALAWMKDNLHGNGFPPILSVNRLNDQFIKVFGLTDSEVGILNDKLTQAKNSLDQISIAAATSQLDSANIKFNVHVPPLPAEGGQIRDQLMQSFADVLGQERYQDMVALGGQAFDGAFHQFALTDTNYEINLVPTTQPGGETVYAVKEILIYPEGSISTGSSTVNPASIANAFPVLSHFLPPNSLILPK
jgi:hypothetical protein